jgi:hypothetical protein
VDWLVILAVLLVFFGVWAKFQYVALSATPPGGTTRTQMEVFHEAFELLRFHVDRLVSKGGPPSGVHDDRDPGDHRLIALLSHSCCRRSGWR